MAIVNKTPEAPSEKERILLEINNGDLEALGTIREKWAFKDEESVLRFALAVLIQAEDNAVSVKTKDGKSTSLRPSDNLLEAKKETSE